MLNVYSYLQPISLTCRIMIFSTHTFGPCNSTHVAGKIKSIYNKFETNQTIYTTFNILIMSSDAADSDSEITSSSTTFAIFTTQKTTPLKADSKAVPKVTKDTKTKETKFTVSKDNYLDFLKALLSKHGQKRYKITEWSVFSFKYLCPPAWKYVYVTL